MNFIKKCYNFGKGLLYIKKMQNSVKNLNKSNIRLSSFKKCNFEVINVKNNDFAL